MPKRKGRKPGPKPGRKANVPFTVAVHGRGIDIDATFENGDILANLSELLTRVGGHTPGATPVPDPTITVEAVAEIIPTLTDETLAAAYELVGAEIDKRAATRNGVPVTESTAQA